MALIRETLTPGQKPTEEQRADARAAFALPITYDDDAPKLTWEQLAQFRKVNADGREREPFTLPLPWRKYWTQRETTRNY